MTWSDLRNNWTGFYAFWFLEEQFSKSKLNFLKGKLFESQIEVYEHCQSKIILLGVVWFGTCI